MSELERLTITLTPELAATVRGAVGEGDYASSSEVIRDALRAWRDRRAEQTAALSGLRESLQSGFDDERSGRVRGFDPDDLKAAGRRKSRGG